MFETGKIQVIETILNHKEQRVQLQNQLLSKYLNEALLVFTLNIPGPVKNNKKIEQLFHWGQLSIQEMFEKKQIQPVYTKEIKLPSGLDWFVAVPVDPYSLKKSLIEIEEKHPLGRLFDLDVLFAKDGSQRISRQVLGYKQRTCFICEKPAKACARNQTHSLKELQKKIAHMIDVYEQRNLSS
ncbi:citrate lyase holo-[acyl-carrier protein] synthase [Enterococcus ratti]|uniref:citrate lyase holo-[acyl-carrier protein] synthase n=1 Tax=Enterococcus ratti TaxID=150033 RepID=A0A1L8WSJ2_9ENTE|nr:citrate lyase holo-[acyl-carrier protein] synthase [Enterococcus ratti]OJG83980.1 triphosphoribosyl-dephospho-CoA synthase [Enterococcus ratti]